MDGHCNAKDISTNLHVPVMVAVLIPLHSQLNSLLYLMLVWKRQTNDKRVFTCTIRDKIILCVF